MKHLKSLILTFALFSSATISAKVIQILHTNDLHSYFEGTRGGIGGYAQLKTVLDKLRTDADTKGIPTLHLDGGDFGEGSSFYFSDHGVDTLKALDLLGVDVTVLGNHDFMLGGQELRRQMKKAKLKATMLSANVKGKRLLGLHKLLPSYKDFDFEGKKVRVFGLTTNEIHYQYPLRPLAFISSFHKAGIKQAAKANKDNVDFTIALTHIGLPYDIQLVENTRSIDMVVGGHSHILLSKPQLTKNLEGRLIPILQAGAHAGYVGSMLVDLKGDGEAEMLDYKMHYITKDMSQEPTMEQFVQEAYQKRETYFNGRSWDEVVGFSEIPLTGNHNGHNTDTRTCWSKHMARLTRTTAKTDLGLQFDVFQGERVEAGPIRFGDVIDNFPRIRKWGDKGWKISRALVSGFILKKILNYMANSPVALQVTIDGIQAKDRVRGITINYDATVHRSHEALINGQELSSLRYYTIGLPSEVPYGILKMFGILSYTVLHDLRTVQGSDMWPLLENYLKDNSPLKCLAD